MRPAQTDSGHRRRRTRKGLSKPGRPWARPPASPEPTQPGRRADERGEPLSCSPPQSHRLARTPASDVHEGRRPRVRQLRGRPCGWSCACRLSGDGPSRCSVYAPAGQHLQKRIARVPVEVNRQASAHCKAPGRPASPPTPQCRPEPGGISLSTPPIAAETPQEAL